MLCQMRRHIAIRFGVKMLRSTIFSGRASSVSLLWFHSHRELARIAVQPDSVESAVTQFLARIFRSCAPAFQRSHKHDNIALAVWGWCRVLLTNAPTVRMLSSVVKLTIDRLRPGAVLFPFARDSIQEFATVVAMEVVRTLDERRVLGAGRASGGNPTVECWELDGDGFDDEATVELRAPLDAKSGSVAEGMGPRPGELTVECASDAQSEHGSVETVVADSVDSVLSVADEVARAFVEVVLARSLEVEQ